jgi:hypothetical protein
MIPGLAMEWVRFLELASAISPDPLSDLLSDSVWGFLSDALWVLLSASLSGFSSAA